MQKVFIILSSIIFFSCAHCPVNPNGGGGGGSCGGVSCGGANLGKLMTSDIIAMNDISINLLFNKKAKRVCRLFNKSFVKHITVIVEKTIVKPPFLSAQKQVFLIKNMNPRSSKDINYELDKFLFLSETVDYEIVSARYN